MRQCDSMRQSAADLRQFKNVTASVKRQYITFTLPLLELSCFVSLLSIRIQGRTKLFCGSSATTANLA
jgi:hypothetical protein